MALRDRLSSALGGVIGLGVDVVTDALRKANNAGAEDGKSEDVASMALVTAGQKPEAIPPQAAQDNPKGLLYDPFALIDQLGYRDRPSGLTYATLRETAKRVPTYLAIEQTRLTQVSNFATPQIDKRDPGFEIKLRDDKATPSKDDTRRMIQLTDWMLQTGSTWGPGRDDFKTFLRKFTRDSLELDQGCFEVVRNRKGVPAEFYCIDGATIRLADVPPGAETQTDADTVKYVQVYDEIIIAEFSPTDLCFGVRNPRSDIRVNGYGYCLHPDSRVATDRGMIRIGDLVDSEFRIAIGGKVYPATAFASGVKKTWALRLKDNREIKASPDHRFLCMGEDGCWGWKPLSSISAGDVVAVDLSPVEGGAELPPYQYTPGRGAHSAPWGIVRAGDDLWEVIGWLVGDGSFSVKTGRFCGKAISLCYADGEKDIAERHRAVLRGYGLPDSLYPAGPGLCGEVKFNHEGFGRWLMSAVGMQQRLSGLPASVFGLPIAQRAAFLRGLFSADGHRGSSDVPFLASADREVLRDTQRVLASLGIRSRWIDKRIMKDVFGKGMHEYNDGKLYVYDKELFDERVGFIQDHKQPLLSDYQGTREDTVAGSFAHRAASHLRDIGKIDRRVRGLLEEPPRWGVTRQWLAARVEDSQLREDLQWGQAEVLAVEQSDEEVEMCDLSVGSDEHAFTVDGVVVHNSEIEMLIQVVTASLWAFEYNRKFFCAAGDTLVTTRTGTRMLANLVGQEFDIWNGRQWRPARAVETGHRPLVRTKLWNGLEVKTSPEHRFRVVPREGIEPVWRQQSELKHGDWALVNAQAVDTDWDDATLFVGKQYDSCRAWGREFQVTSELVRDLEFWEMIGFALGDGYWPDLQQKCAPQWLRIFPHYEKDAPLFERFLSVLRRHGIHGDTVTINKHQQRQDGQWGYPAIQIQHKAFAEWLQEIGFQSSTAGKRVPEILFCMPLAVRRAVLRGLFSADGHTHVHITDYRTPTVCAVDTRFRQDILQLLWAAGIATNEVGEGWSRGVSMVVQDVRAFVEHVGYLQAYKNEGISRNDSSCHRWDRLHPRVSQALAVQIKGNPNWLGLDKKDRELVGLASRGECRLSRPRAIRVLESVGADVPEWLHYHQVAVDVLDEEPVGHELMFDVEVLDDEHIFLANGIAVHNSQGTSAKGILNFKGSVPDSKIDAFRRQWQMTLSGVANSWRTPMTNCDDLQWVNLSQTNRDMEFSSWMDWLIKVTCAVCQFDPAEINFTYGNSGQTGQMFATPVDQKLKQSKDRGLRPLLDDISQWLNVNLIWRLDPRYKLVFIGLDARSADQAVALGKQKVTFLMTVDELRAEDDLPPLPDGKGECVLDPTWLQFAQAKDQANNPQPGPMGEPPPQPGQEPMPQPDAGEVPGAAQEAGGGEEGQGTMDAVFGQPPQAEKSLGDRYREARRRLGSGQTTELRKAQPTVKRTVVTYEVEIP